MWVYAGTLFIAFVTNYLAVSRLKAYHRTKWHELECPTLTKPAKSSRYFLFGRYEELQDPILDRYVLPLRIATIVALTVLLALFAIVGATFWNAPDVQVTRQPIRGEGRGYHPLNAVGASLLFLVAAGVLVKMWVLHRLKKHHRLIWQELECPTFWDWSGGFKLFRFMISRRRKEIGDVQLNRLAIAMLTLWVCSFVFIAGLLSGVLVT